MSYSNASNLLKKKINLDKFDRNFLDASTDFLEPWPFVKSDFSDIEKNYKLIKHETGEGVFIEKKGCFIVPRESFIKKILQSFNEAHPACEKHNVQIEGFDGIAPESPSEPQFFKEHLNAEDLFSREFIFNQLLELEIFENADCIPNMNNGHAAREPQESYIERILMVRDKNQGNLIGAVAFQIDLKNKDVEITSLAVIASEKRKGLGSLLLQSALLVSMFYGAKSVWLTSTEAGLPLYLKYGFYKEEVDESSQIIHHNTDLDRLSQMELPLLELPLVDSFDNLRALMHFPELKAINYKELECWSWGKFESVLNNNQGKITVKELELLQSHVKISDDLLKRLSDNRITSVTFLGKRPRESTYFSSGLELHSVFSRNIRPCYEFDIESRQPASLPSWH